jgi:hypothetical protein
MPKVTKLATALLITDLEPKQLETLWGHFTDWRMFDVRWDEHRLDRIHITPRILGHALAISRSKTCKPAAPRKRRISRR